MDANTGGSQNAIKKEPPYLKHRASVNEDRRSGRPPRIEKGMRNGS